MVCGFANGSSQSFSVLSEEHPCSVQHPFVICDYLCSFDAAKILCWHVPVIQALHETAELACIFDTHTEQDVSLIAS